MAAKLYTGAPNHALLRHLSLSPGMRVLDLGCGCGDNARALRDGGARVVGLTHTPEEADRARQFCERVVIADLNQPRGTWGLEDDRFHILLASHVLEHLHDPAATLRQAAALLTPEARVYIAVPNMAHHSLRRRLAHGDWSREDFGPFDRTHLHFWSYDTAPEMLAGSGLRLLERHGGEGELPWRVFSTFSHRLSRRVDALCERRWPARFARQTLLIAAPA